MCLLEGLKLTQIYYLKYKSRQMNVKFFFFNVQCEWRIGCCLLQFSLPCKAYYGETNLTERLAKELFGLSCCVTIG